MKKYMGLLLIGLAAGLTGCEKQAQVEETLPICLESVSMNQLFTAAESVLTGMHFQIDKSDRQAGQIITRPLRGGQVFEFWRQDNATAADTAEASMQSIQRIAEIRFDQVENSVCANCQVTVRRLSMPDQPIRGSSGIYDLYTESTGRGQGLQMKPEVEQQMEWISLGNDPGLEKLILQKIVKKISRGGGQ